MLAIAAMSRNRVIGSGGRIPWRIPDELRWFRRMTLGGVVVMGRKTFESLPKPLDGRVTVVLTRDPQRLLDDHARRERYGQVVLARDIETVEQPGVKTWLCGGAQLYEQYLDRCSELYLSVVDREVEGDACFPRFEHLFDPAGVVEAFPDFSVHRWVRNAVAASASSNAPGA